MRYIFILIICFSLINCKKSKSDNQSYQNFKIGIVSDCQYCDCDIKWDRYYKKSPQRLKEAVKELNKHDLTYTIHLGDFIDKDFNSFDSISPIWANLKSKSYHVLGNHDFEVADSLKHLIPQKLGLKDRYYSFKVQNWKFIVLDGNDLSFYGSENKSKKEEAQKMFDSKSKDSLPYLKHWNGGLSNEQMNWVKNELDFAKNQQLNVGFYNHFPANPIDLHNFWNTPEFLNLISGYSNVKLFMNGHNHAGSYLEENGIHFITFKGMVDTENTSAFAYAEITSDSIFINGFGREPSRRLKLK